MEDNMNPIVSVIIPTYNSVQFIRETVESALNQTYKPLEVIVVDDGSTDNTSKIVEEYIKSPSHQVAKSSVEVKYFYQENRGPAAARNRGIKEVKGAYIAFLDADDIWLSQKLEKQIELFREDPSLGLIHSRCRGFINRPQEEVLNSRTAKNGVFAGDIFIRLFWKNFIANSSVVVKKECFEKIGSFNEDKDFISVEDYDMWLRISKEYKVGYIKDTLARYRIHNKGLTKQIDRHYLNERKVIEKIIETYPDIEKSTGASIRCRFAKLYLDYGLDLLDKERLEDAKEKFLISFKYYPLDLRSMGNYFKCLLPIKLFETLKRTKRRLLNSNCATYNKKR